MTNQPPKDGTLAASTHGQAPAGNPPPTVLTKCIAAFAIACGVALIIWSFTDFRITTIGGDIFVHLANYVTRLTFVEFVEALVSVLGLAISVTALYFFYSRVKNQEEQTASQIRKEIDERFSNAITLLGNDKTSARTGAVYALYELAVDREKYRKQVAEILCGHIRSQTQDDEYKKKHTEKPSDDVQTAILVLFLNVRGLKGLYAKFPNDLPLADLSHSYLAGANFIEMMCQRVIFWHANCQGAFFIRANCQGADFVSSCCQGARFRETKCQGANFWNAYCEGAFFHNAQCQGALFFNTQCQGAGFEETNFEGTCSHFGENPPKLSDRIGEKTDLKGVIVSGEINEESAAIIREMPVTMPPDWHERMEKIINVNKGCRPPVSAADAPPDGIITGILEDTPEIRQIAKEIDI